MNCRRIEKLIPLYVGGDLDSDEADAVLSHTQACAGCAELVVGYEESQSWLRSYTPPDFDDASLNDLKLGVLREINRGSGQVTFLHGLTRFFNRRFMLAASAAFLIIFGALAFYIHQRGANVDRSSNGLAAADGTGPEEHTPEITPQPKDIEMAPGAGFSHNRRRRPASFSPRSLAADRLKSFEPVIKRPDQRAVEPAVAVEAVGVRSGDPADSERLLRIEIQTSDPAIRIIWFSPKENDSNPSKPITETD